MLNLTIFLERWDVIIGMIVGLASMYIIKKINSLDTNLAISYLSDLFLAHFFL